MCIVIGKTEKIYDVQIFVGKLEEENRQLTVFKCSVEPAKNPQQSRSNNVDIRVFLPYPTGELEFYNIGTDFFYNIDTSLFSDNSLFGGSNFSKKPNYDLNSKIILQNDILKSGPYQEEPRLNLLIDTNYKTGYNAVIVEPVNKTEFFIAYSHPMEKFYFIPTMQYNNGSILKRSKWDHSVYILNGKTDFGFAGHNEIPGVNKIMRNIGKTFNIKDLPFKLENGEVEKLTINSLYPCNHDMKIEHANKLKPGSFFNDGCFVNEKSSDKSLFNTIKVTNKKGEVKFLSQEKMKELCKDSGQFENLRSDTKFEEKPSVIKPQLNEIDILRSQIKNLENRVTDLEKQNKKPRISGLFDTMKTGNEEFSTNKYYGLFGKIV